MKDFRMDLMSYKDSLIGGLWDIEEVDAEINEMKNAKVGTIKHNWWEKVGEDEFIIYSM